MKVFAGLLLFVSSLASAQCWPGWTCLGNQANVTIADSGEVTIVGANGRWWHKSHVQLINPQMVGSGFKVTAVFDGDDGKIGWQELFTDHHETLRNCHNGAPWDQEPHAPFASDELIGVAVEVSPFRWIMVYAGVAELTFKKRWRTWPGPPRHYLEIGAIERTADHKKHFLHREVIDPIPMGEAFEIVISLKDGIATGNVNGVQFSVPMLEAFDLGYAALLFAVDPSHLCDGPITRNFLLDSIQIQ